MLGLYTSESDVLINRIRHRCLKIGTRSERNRTRLIYGIRRSLNGSCSITEVKQRRARLIIGWVTAWDCQVLYTRVGLREPRKSDGSSD